MKDPEPVHTPQPQTEPEPEPEPPAPAFEQPAENQPINQEQSQEPPVEPSAKAPSETPGTPESVESAPPVSQPAEDKEPVDTTSEDAFRQKWLELIDTVFANQPTLHSPMKYYPVEIKDNVVYVSLKNELQLNDFEIQKTNVLQYLRANYSEAISDVVSKVDVNIQTPKFILDAQDKMNELNKQNPDFKEFVRILNLRQDE